MTFIDQAKATVADAGITARTTAQRASEITSPIAIIRDGGLERMDRIRARQSVEVIALIPVARGAELPGMIGTIRAAVEGNTRLTLTNIGAETQDEAFKALTNTLTFTALVAI